MPAPVRQPLRRAGSRTRVDRCGERDRTTTTFGGHDLLRHRQHRLVGGGVGLTVLTGGHGEVPAVDERFAEGGFALLPGFTTDLTGLTYRLSRVEAVQELDEPVHRGSEADLEQVWQRRRAAFAAALPSTSATVRLRATRRAELVATAPGVADEQPDGPGSLRIEVAFGDHRHAERVLWMLGDDVEVLAPAPLRAMVAARAAAVAAPYS